MQQQQQQHQCSTDDRGRTSYVTMNPLISFGLVLALRHSSATVIKFVLVLVMPYL